MEMKGLFTDEYGQEVICLGLVEDDMAIVYLASDSTCQTYSVPAGTLTKVYDAA